MRKFLTTFPLFSVLTTTTATIESSGSNINCVIINVIVKRYFNIKYNPFYNNNNNLIKFNNYKVRNKLLIMGCSNSSLKISNKSNGDSQGKIIKRKT